MENKENTESKESIIKLGNSFVAELTSAKEKLAAVTLSNPDMQKGVAVWGRAA